MLSEFQVAAAVKELRVFLVLVDFLASFRLFLWMVDENEWWP